MVCVAAPASENETKSQLEADKALNSEAIVGCVARTSDPSAFAVNVPIRRMEMILRIVDDASGCACLNPSCSGSKASGSVPEWASVSSAEGRKYQGMKSSSELSESDDDVRELSLDDVESRREDESRGDVSVGTLPAAVWPVMVRCDFGGP